MWAEYNRWNGPHPSFDYENNSVNNHKNVIINRINTSDKHSKVPEAWSKKIQEKNKTMNPSSKDIKYKSFKTFLKDTLKSSLITSIPEIAVTKSWTKKIIKIIVFLLCLVGFIYQTLDFLWLYLSYPTVVNVLISNPFEIEQPSVTICNRNRKRRTYICTQPKTDCTFLQRDTFCAQYGRYCKTTRKFFTGIPFVNTMIEGGWDWEYQVNESHTESMISKCKKIVEGVAIPCEKPYRQVPVVTPIGEPNMCYAIESLEEKPDGNISVYPNTFTIELDINTEPEEYLVYTEPVLIQIAVHNRRRLVNPYTEGYSLSGGSEYEATVTMTEKKLLPAPYNTNCTDYVELWKKNNGTGPLNDLMCIELCKLQTLVKRGECIDKNVAYPHMEPLCPRGNVTTTTELIKNCSKQCQPACSDHHYEVRYEKVNNYDSVCKNEHCRFSKIKVIFYFNQFRVTKFQYQPKFESVEMFSYIGGYMGMWLGLSLVSLFDFLETLVSLLYYPIGHLRWKNKKKKHRSNLNIFKHDPYHQY